MRRMRGFFNGWVVTLMFTAAIGYLAVRHWPSPHGSQPSESSSVASATTEAKDPVAKEHGTKEHGTKERAPAAEAKGHGSARLEHEPEPAHGGDAAPVFKNRGLLHPLQATSNVKSFCETVEFRGPEGGRITGDQWKKVMVQFHTAKKELLAWLEDHRGQLPKEVADHMEVEVRELRLQRPPTPDFPDLGFRGIGLWSRPLGERPIIKLGGGFGKLVEQHPMRAKFELSRLIAQTWAPCELGRSPVARNLPAGGAWNELLSCLGVKDENACGPGSFSEAGWAVSSAIASVASAPGCVVPAFAQGAGGGCLKDIESTGRAPAAVPAKHHEAPHKPAPAKSAPVKSAPVKSAPVQPAHHEEHHS